MKLLGRELTFNNNEIWHKGNFDPTSKVDKAEFDNLKIGGRNLFKETNILNINAYVGASSQGTYSGKLNFASNRTCIVIEVEEGEPYSISYKEHKIGNRFSFGFYTNYEGDVPDATVGKFDWWEYPDTNGKFEGYIAPQGCKYLILYFSNTSFNINNIPKGLKIEKGNKATDWTPAPEDVQAEIETRVKITDFQIEQGKIATLISNVETIEGEVDATKSKVSTLEQTVGGFRQEVSSLETKVDNIQVGGRNLILNSDFSQGLTNWTKTSNAISLEVGGGYRGNGLRLVITNAGTVTPRQRINLELMANDTLTGQVKVKTIQGNFSNMIMRVANQLTIPLVSVKQLDNDWELYTYQVTVSSPITLSNDFGFYNTTGEFIIDEIKLERGNKATDWTPAPEDIQAELDSKASVVAINEIFGIVEDVEGDLELHKTKTASINSIGHVYSAEFTATLSTSWSGSTAPYTQTVTINGITSAHNPIIDVVMSGTYSTDQQRIEQWGYIYRAVTGTNQITFYASEKPTISLPIRVKVVE